MTDTTTRNTELRRMLHASRPEVMDELTSRIRARRAGASSDGPDDLEEGDADTQGEIRFALLELRTESLAQIDQALARLDVGEYGTCVECAGEIDGARLRALPFAVRCRACEDHRDPGPRAPRVGAPSHTAASQ